jgi:hypothetical protein
MADGSSYSVESERAQARDHLQRLVHEGGSGWHAYVLDRAEKLVRSEPMVHAGLVAELEQHIGPEATAKARKALEWFHKRGRAR